MAIATQAQLVSGVKQRISWVKTTTRTITSNLLCSLFDVAGTVTGGSNNGYSTAGTLAGTSTANGVVPTDATPGCPVINFASGVGYISKFEFYNASVCKFNMYDMLFKAGAYSYAAGTTTLSSQPAISGRCPDYAGGSTFGNGVEIWLEVVTAFATGNNWQVQVTYTDQSGNAGHSSVITVALANAALPVGRMLQIPLAAGDSGVQKIESVIVTNGATAMTAGTFNILLLRPLVIDAYASIVSTQYIWGATETDLPIVYGDSALIIIVAANASNTGTPRVVFEISAG